MIQLFKTQRNYSGITLFILLLALQVSRFAELFVSGYELKLLDLKFSLLSFLVNTAVIFGCGLLLNNIANRYQFFDTASNLPAAVLFVFCTFIPANQNIDTWLIILAFSILILNKLIKAYQKERPGRNYFDSAFLLAIISLFFPQLSILLLAIALSVFVLSIPKLSFFKLILVAFTLPLVLGVTILSTINNWQLVETIRQTIIDNLTNFTAINFETFRIPTILTLITGIISYLFWQSRKPYLTIYQRPLLKVSTIFLIIGLISVFLFLNLQLVSLIALFFALALLFSFFLFYNKSFLANVLFTLFILYGLLYPWIKDLNLSL